MLIVLSSVIGLTVTVVDSIFKELSIITFSTAVSDVLPARSVTTAL